MSEHTLGNGVGSMSRIDVLAVMDAEISALNLEGGAGVAIYALTQARDAVAELIEAARALQDAMDENDSNKFDIGPATRFLAADKRHRAALTAIALPVIGGY